MEPADAVATEDGLPVDVTRPHRRGGGVPPIRAAERGAHAETALHEVETIPSLPSDAVVGEPAHVLLVDATPEDQILEQTPDGVVCNRRDDRGALPEATTQPARDVVLATALETVKVRVVAIRPSPGSKRSITSPSATRS